MTYEPRPGSVPAKVIETLRNEGPLPLAVLAEKIEQDANTIRSSVVPAIEHGAVKRKRNPAGQWIYSLGDGIPLRRENTPGAVEGPIQRTVSAADFPGVDIDAIHKNRIWPPEPAEARFTLTPDGRLRIVRPGEFVLVLDAEQTEAVRKLFSEAA